MCWRPSVSGGNGLCAVVYVIATVSVVAVGDDPKTVDFVTGAINE